MSNLQNVYNAPVLESKTTSGQNKYWQAHVGTDGADFYTYTTYWQTLKSGELGNKNESAAEKIFPKNVGRSNETSPKDQAIFDTNSAFKKQIDRGYHEIGVESTKLTLPMLAHQFADKAHLVEYPVFINPKFDGLRCLSDGKKMWSRKGIEFDPQIVSHLVDSCAACDAKVGQTNLIEAIEGEVKNSLYLDTLGHILDGELILPAPYTLQDTMSAAKKFRENSGKLLYRIYDVVLPDLGFAERYKILQEIMAHNTNPNIILAPVWVANNEEEVMERHEQLTAEGWEGSILRRDKIGYAVNQRNAQLLKIKDFLEEEFQCVGIVPGKVEHIGGILVFVNKDGAKFNATPKFPHEQRVLWLNNPSEVVGKRWTIRFQSWTRDGIPQFGRAINIRDEDLQG